MTANMANAHPLAVPNLEETLRDRKDGNGIVIKSYAVSKTSGDGVKETTEEEGPQY